ncbi:uncharacterized protein DUF551 [Stenotrophomonas rhizophila]|uniref:Uncharacterized protein DUF551 n=1 Tax=Stenotrophomonas rhizophila TaxID=216778 RepID=A0A498CPJ0_9GAMM|nr:DUF551 domain-containing protein [Stenotrophomonas rhizophila]RLK53428.1 uncharacterized protein DUF551 [Stenotrophomonas rhizophila]
MNHIEKRARELLAIEHRHDQRRAKGIRIGHKSVSRDDHLAVCAIVAAITLRDGELLAGGAVNLLGQENSVIVAAQILDVVPAAALGADEEGAVVVGGQSDQSVGVELAEVAAEHEAGVHLAHDRHVTPQWQPIESAPKATRSILVWCPERQNQYMVYWDRLGSGEWRNVGGCTVLTESPTHWMPLPAPPEVSP